MSLVFSEGKLPGSPKGSVVLKFPKFKLTLMLFDEGVFAEVIEGSRRTTYGGRPVDDGLELEKATKKVMENIWKGVQFDHKK